MLSQVIEEISRELNSFLTLSSSNTRKIVIPANVVDQDGSHGSGLNNKIILSLINIEQEAFAANVQPSYQRTSQEDFNKMPTPLSVNLYVLFSAYYDRKNYLEGLRYLSSLISFFQQKPVFDQQNTPTLNDQIEKLQFQVVSLTLSELSQLWGTIGAKYMPSIIYKIRMITYQMDGIREIVPDIKGISTDTDTD